MRGSVRRRGKGWEWRARTPEGREVSKGGYATRYGPGGAEEALATALAAMAQGKYVVPDRMTVQAYLEHIWLPAVKNTVAQSTYNNFTIILRRHIGPRIGSVRLQKLTEAHLIRMYGELAESGHRYSTDEKPKGLSPKSIRHVHTMIHHALADAVEWHYVPRNVAAGRKAKPPKVKTPDMKVWSANELQTFLAAVAADRLYPLWRFMAMTGVRRGEALGLQWSDVDLKAGTARISKARTSHGISTPKTDRSRRTIDLDPGTTTVLKNWRTAQLKERMRWGELWTDTGLVFTREDGKGYHPDGVSGIFERAVTTYNAEKIAKAKEKDERPEGLLPRIRLHDLRHTHATLLLANGEHPKVVSERLGHASVGFTLSVYAHVLPGLQKEAVGRLATLVDG